MKGNEHLKRLEENYIQNEITTKDGFKMIFFTKRPFDEDEKAALESLTRKELGTFLVQECGHSKHKIQ